MTVPQLEAIGFTPTVYLDDGPERSPTANRRNAERALRDALRLRVDLLLCEDDIDTAPDLPQALEAARRSGQVVTMYLEKLHTHPPRYHRLIDPKGGSPTEGPVGLWKVERYLQSWYGTQCVYLPLHILERLAAVPTFGVATGDPIDRWIRPNLQGMLVALPNPVQHRSPPTVVNDDRKPRISPTYHLERVGSWEDAWPSSTTRTLRR